MKRAFDIVSCVIESLVFGIVYQVLQKLTFRLRINYSFLDLKHRYCVINADVSMHLVLSNTSVSSYELVYMALLLMIHSWAVCLLTKNCSNAC